VYIHSPVLDVVLSGIKMEMYSEDIVDGIRYATKIA